MQSGWLGRRVQLLRPQRTRDAMNEPVTSFVEAGGAIWASRRDISDGERIRAQQAGVTLSSRFQVRRMARTDQLDATWQLIEGGQRFQVVGKKQLLANGETGALVGYELTCAASADGAPPSDEAP